MREHEELTIGTCGALRRLGDMRPCVLKPIHTIHQDLAGERWTVKQGLLLELPTQRPADGDRGSSVA
jgi:hypothetical protein